VPIQTEVEIYPLEQAREALVRMKAGEVVGTAVLVP
jgi:D-arabinose 1-dehydrogenase-like Zn-dependent alcohol dehydrogenase